MKSQHGHDDVLSNWISVLQIMLLANGSIVIPNNTDDDLAVSAHTADSLFLQFVPNPPNAPMREPSKCIETIVDKSSGKEIRFRSL